MTNDEINLVRRVLCWGFAALSLIHLQVAVREIRYILDGHHTYYLHWLYFTASLSVAVVTISGFAWGALWKRWRSARVWAIAGSIMQLAVFAVSVILPWRSAVHWEALLLGAIGVIFFSWSLPLPNSNRN